MKGYKFCQHNKKSLLIQQPYKLMGKHYNIVTMLLLFNIVLDVLANAIRQKIEIRGIIIKRKEDHHYLQIKWCVC